VARARVKGWIVRAVTRRADGDFGWRDDGAIERVVVDLAAPGAVDALGSALQGVTGVVHAAAAMRADDAGHARDTLAGTAALLRALETAPSAALVHISSMAVYDYLAPPPLGVVSVNTALETAEWRRDPYTRAKLAQEEMVRAAAAQLARPIHILRPGYLTAGRNLWSDHLGVRRGRFALVVGGQGQLPLCAVDHCAEVAVNAIGSQNAENATVHTSVVLDPELPTRDAAIAALRRITPSLLAVRVPWPALRLLAAAGQFLEGATGERLTPPGLLRPAVLAARLRPLRFATAATGSTL
jgi:nucleoside-diphosphate-sugar epimerase